MAKNGRFRTNLEYWLVRGVLGFFALLPRLWAVRLGVAIAPVGLWFPKLRRTGERNLEMAFPDMRIDERERLLRGSFKNLGRLLGLFSHFLQVTPDEIRQMVEYDPTGLPDVRKAEAEGRGILFLTAHIGAWEFLSFTWSALERPGSFIVRRIDNPRIETLVDKFRTRFGNETIDKTTAVRRSLRVLRDGSWLGILADSNTHPKEGVFVPFMGHLACATAGAATFALRTGAAVIPIAAVWQEERQRYLIYLDRQVELVRTGDNERDVEVNTARFTEAIERMVRKYPDQYLWIHRRWKTRPPGEPPLYD
ncbi:MAG TPA: lysophospholipid acyltransferase family protein [Pyrinomonadaceae bacterium]|nr:lysophospholipid acyltransferase family protein [Pyrinomonadaceae bacterium]